MVAPGFKLYTCDCGEIVIKFADDVDELTKEGMLEGLSAPIHPGAMKYYQEAGLK